MPSMLECRRWCPVLGSAAVLLTVQHADHAFNVLVRSGRTRDDVLVELLDGMADWMTDVLEPRS